MSRVINIAAWQPRRLVPAPLEDEDERDDIDWQSMAIGIFTWHEIVQSPDTTGWLTKVLKRRLQWSGDEDPDDGLWWPLDVGGTLRDETESNIAFGVRLVDFLDRVVLHPQARKAIGLGAQIIQFPRR